MSEVDDDGLETPEEIFEHYGDHDAEMCVVRDAYNELKRENKQLLDAGRVVIFEKHQLNEKIAACEAVIMEALEDNSDYGCECGADNGSSYTEVVCFWHQAIRALK